MLNISKKYKLSKSVFLKLSQNSLFTNTIKLTSISMIANFIGFLVPLYIAYEYGVSGETDSFFLSYGIIGFIGVIFSGALRSISIPFLIDKQSSKKAFDGFISTIISYIFKYIGLLTLILLAIFYSVFKITDKTLYYYLFLSSPIFFFVVINSFGYGVLNSKKQYIIAELSPLSRAIIIILSIFLFKDYLGIGAVIIGYNLGEIFKTLHLYYAIHYKNKINIWAPSLNKSEVSPFLKEGSFQIVSGTINASSPLIDRLVASFLIAGSISLLDYGDKVYMVFYTILNSFLVILLSKWSSDVLNKSFTLTKLNKILLIIFSLSSILFLCIFILKEDITQILYPTVSQENQYIIALIISLNMGGFIFNSVSQTINRATIALRSSRIMIITSISKLVINIILDIILAYYYGVIGIAIATIGVQFVGLIINYVMVRNQLSRKNEILLTVNV